MRKSRFSDSQIMAILKQAQSGVPVADLCREHGMSSGLFVSALLATSDCAPDDVVSVDVPR